MPGDWCVGVSDVVGSTKAIAAGQYKAVNMAGASVIAAVMNALGTKSFPFVFGGDGSAMAVPGEDAGTLEEALTAARCFVAEELDLGLRVGTVRVSEIRARGLDVRVARFTPSEHVAYAMFTGGGIDLPEAAPGTRPDLTGLSCRWEAVEAHNGRILSLIALPADDRQVEFARHVHEIVDIAEAVPRHAHPAPVSGLRSRFPPGGARMEVAAARGMESALKHWLRLLPMQALGAFLFATGCNFGNFDPNHYREMLSRNSDFRKFDDGLRMTLDCDAETAGRIESTLATAKASGLIHYGLHAQDAALVTCFVPSALTDDHVHFIDGAAGGYAEAAKMLKAMMAG